MGILTGSFSNRLVLCWCTEGKKLLRLRPRVLHTQSLNYLRFAFEKWDASNFPEFVHVQADMTIRKVRLGRLTINNRGLANS